MADTSIIDTTLPGVRVFELSQFADERGWFTELWNLERYASAGLDVTFAQSNLSFSQRGVLRGMHFQWPNEQGKLITVLNGSVYDVVIDVRVGSPTFAQWFGAELSSDNRRQLWAPAGLAHGFVVLSDTALVHYHTTVPYDRASDRAIAWDDPDVAVEWPLQPTLVSSKDRAAPRLGDVAPDTLPRYRS